MTTEARNNGPAEVALDLTQRDLEEISSLIYARTGMIFGETKRYYIERRIADLMRQTGASTVRGYITLLRSDAVAAERLINTFTINETYFYREHHQLACLSRSILPDLIRSRRAGDRIRIWSMPCSSGEEPYSIAIWLLENWMLVDAYNVDIVGSDIDTDALQLAREAIYSQRALQRLPASVVDRYFGPERAGERQLIVDLRESVTFRQANIIDSASVASAGLFDVIFCRNLLIYFDDAARAQAVSNLRDSLVPGGYICLGHTESMSRISEMFEVARFPDAIVYRRGDRRATNG